VIASHTLIKHDKLTGSFTFRKELNTPTNTLYLFLLETFESSILVGGPVYNS